MKPKLILLNGPPGIGKSTLSQRYVDNHPMALNIDIDRLWHSMGQWQDNRDKSDSQKYKFALGLAEIHLRDGYDVIVADMIMQFQIYERFERIAKKFGAIMHELVLIAPVDEAIERCKTRARSMGHATGFRPGGILDTGGKEKLLESMYEDMVVTVNQRPNLVTIDSQEGHIDETYRQILATID